MAYRMTGSGMYMQTAEVTAPFSVIVYAPIQKVLLVSEDDEPTLSDLDLQFSTTGILMTKIDRYQDSHEKG